MKFTYQKTFLSKLSVDCHKMASVVIDWLVVINFDNFIKNYQDFCGKFPRTCCFMNAVIKTKISRALKASHTLGTFSLATQTQFSRLRFPCSGLNALSLRIFVSFASEVLRTSSRCDLKRFLVRASIKIRRIFFFVLCALRSVEK